LVRVRIGGVDEQLTWEEWEERVRAGRVPPEAEVMIPAVTGDRWVKASQLEVYRSLRDDAPSAFRMALARGDPPIATALLVGFQIRVWWLAWIPAVEGTLASRFTNWTGAILENGESWRLITMGLLHTNIWHVSLNMMWLAYTGSALERVFGRWLLLLLYFTSVLGGSVLSMYGSPDRQSLGASGGVFGLIAAVTVFGFVRPELLPARMRQVFGFAMLPYLLIMFLSGLQSETTDNWCHFGGLVTGTLLGLVVDPPKVQRRPGWNRRVASAIGAVAAVVLFGSVLFGPRILPLRDSEVARVIDLPAPQVPETPEYRSLWFDVPVGWTTGTTAAGDVGFTSRAGPRAFAATESTEEAPMSAEALSDRWVAHVRDGWPDARPLRGEPAVLCGNPGFHRRVSVGTGPAERVLDWWGTAHGLWTLQVVWEVETSREGRLAPLRDRLLGNVRWTEPKELVEARSTAGRPYADRAARVRYALEQLRWGEVDDALASIQKVLAEAPQDEEAWSALLEAAKWYPDRQDPGQTWARALAARPEPRTAIAVVTGLEASGRKPEAEGLLEVAWTLFPGDRMVARARRSRGMGTGLTPEGVPWEVAFDPVDGRARPPAEVDARLARPLDLASAAVAGRQYEAEKVAIHDALERAIGTDDREAVRLLLIAKLGQTPQDLQDAESALASELAAEAPPAWLPADLAPRVMADAGIRALLNADAPPGVAGDGTGG
jgi:membrane associated rhomboid family serine protease